MIITEHRDTACIDYFTLCAPAGPFEDFAVSAPQTSAALYPEIIKMSPTIFGVAHDFLKKYIRRRLYLSPEVDVSPLLQNLTDNCLLISPKLPPRSLYSVRPPR